MGELPMTKEEEMARQDVEEWQICFGHAPILKHKYYEIPSVFTPENLLREARRQKGLAVGTVPAICVLDPDGDLVDYLRDTHCAKRHPTWACYHTALDTFVYEGIEFGVIGRVVGASFAVLVAEELFASGCELLISITSAGQIISLDNPPYVVLIEKALRDEGTSYHYLPPSPYSYLHPGLREAIYYAWDNTNVPLYLGSSWTTDAPFRETEEMIQTCRKKGILTVEMEAAALYALAEVKQYKIICFAHVTNQMGQTEGDFEKGQAQGSLTALRILTQTARAFPGSDHSNFPIFVNDPMSLT
jgi:uridine phosphorylase